MRIKYLDFLKSISIIGVILIHIVANSVINFDGESSTWWIVNGFGSLVRWSVPVFFMVSGALLLSSKREISIKDFYKNRVMKLLMPFLIWSVFYFILQGMRGEYSMPINIMTFLKLFISGEIFGRLWFFYSLLGLYIVTPFLKTFVQNTSKENLRFFLFLWFFTTITQGILKEFFSMELAVDLSYVSGYIGYFVLGYYLRLYGAKINIKLLSTLAVISFLTTFMGTYYMSTINGSFNNYFYGYLTPNTIIVSIFIFVLAENKINIERNMNIFELLSKNSLGIYLIHTLSLGVVEIVGLDAMFPPIIWVPLTLIITTLLSLLISIIIKKMPVVKNILL